MARLTLINVACLAWLGSGTSAEFVRAAPKQSPSSIPILGQATSQGCYAVLSSTAVRVGYSGSDHVSVGNCREFCARTGMEVFILHQSSCFCAVCYPPQNAIVDDSKCDFPCPGYALDACGGKVAYSVFNTGLELEVDNDEPGTTAPVYDDDDDDDEPISTTVSQASLATSSSSILVSESPAGDEVGTSVLESAGLASTALPKSEEPVQSAPPTSTTQTNDSARGRSNMAVEISNKIQGLFFRSSDRLRSSSQKSTVSQQKVDL